MADYRNDIRDYIELEKRTLDALDVDAIDAALNLLDETRLAGGTIWIFGNGGSAATASHIQNDFNKGLSEHLDEKFRFQCLSDNIATLTAIANDISYDEVYRFPLKNNIGPHDIVFAISGSGNSANVLRAVEYAREQGAKVIAATGFSGGALAEMADVLLHAPINSMQVTEDIHMVFDHLMMSVLYKRLCGIDHVKA